MDLLIPKLDHALSTAYLAYQETSAGEEDAGISITLRFTGSIEPIVDLGFDLHAVVGNMALGSVRFRDLPIIAECPEVLRMSAGSDPELHLDKALKDIRARTLTLDASGAPKDGLWYVPKGGNGYQHLKKIADGTGTGVIVAVIDSGIDYTHPAFLAQLEPNRKTRILRIWDMSLIPKNPSELPDPALLFSTESYGVQYIASQINQALASKLTIRHRDNDGHGTFVTGIAAGGPLFPSGYKGNTSFMGVAPEALIIAVKFLDIPKVHYQKIGPNGKLVKGKEVGKDNRLFDAVVYCLRTARSLNMPVVVNMSFGYPDHPGDGLDDHAFFLDQLMNPDINIENNLAFPKGAILVRSAGNDGFPDSREVLRIKVPTSGEIKVPFKLKDKRDRIQKKGIYRKNLSVHFWYRSKPEPQAVRFAMCLPYDTNYGSDVGVSNQPKEFKLGFRVKTGPPKTSEGIVITSVPRESAVHRVSLMHQDPGPVFHPSDTMVHRHYCRFMIEPKEVGHTVSYVDGVYWIRIKAPENTVIFAKCVSDSLLKWCLDDPNPDPTNIEVMTESTILDPLGQNVITVTSYDAIGYYGSKYSICKNSSRGPLRNYGDSTLKAIPKPDIAAPGENIKSVVSKYGERLFPSMSPAQRAGKRFEVDFGAATSWAAPIVTGVVATMLDKNNKLNTTEVRNILQNPSNTRKGVNPIFKTPEENNAEYRNAFGAGMIDALAVHKNTQ